jgi:hypothetical protein
MANPVINGVTVKYVNDRGYKLPGEAAELFIDAVDSDNTTINVTIQVKDSAGNSSPAQTVTIIQNDLLTYTVSGTGVKITQDPSQPNHFFVV